MCIGLVLFAVSCISVMIVAVSFILMSSIVFICRFVFTYTVISVSCIDIVRDGVAVLVRLVR